ncbi:MAG: hypothetical protein IPG53_06470 [Ignavibacteriales bacterium]|nr:hypothetical protein [Ignavibacteriales bacterium]
MIDLFFDIFQTIPIFNRFWNEQHRVMRNAEVDVMYYHDFMAKAELIILERIKEQRLIQIDVKVLRSFTLGGIKLLIDI